MIQFQSSSVFAHAWPHAPATPALLQTMCTRSERVQRLLRELLQIFRFRHVGSDAEYVDALLPQFRLRQPQRVLLDVREHDLHTFGGEAFGEAAADAAGAAGHDGDFIRNSFIELSSLASFR